MKMRAGFTFIEMLITITIIGLLSAVVLQNVNLAREKAKDASVKKNLTSIRTEAQLYYDANGHFGDVLAGSCNTGVFASQTIQDQITEALTRSPDASAHCTSDSADGTDDMAWSVEVALVTGGYWCVDGNNSSGYSSDADAANGVCDYTD